MILFFFAAAASLLMLVLAAACRVADFGTGLAELVIFLVARCSTALPSRIPLRTAKENTYFFLR
jgi:hypothetical protein